MKYKLPPGLLRDKLETQSKKSAAEQIDDMIKFFDSEIRKWQARHDGETDPKQKKKTAQSIVKLQKQRDKFQTLRDKKS